MPIIETGGTLNIVAHQDDDILFMNPDIFESITNGEPVTTVYVTAGDAGLGQAYWEAREAGAKAAYALMAGSDDWVDEVQTVPAEGGDFQIASSYLASDPDIRLYFMRLPDGGGLLDEGSSQSLAKLWYGTLETVTTIDGSATYSHADVSNSLTGLMELHAPSQFRLQLDDGPYAFGEHTDHLRTADFSQEALESYTGGSYTVTSYVNYQSSDLAENLSPEEAALSLSVMEAYAAHDLGVLDEYGNLLPVYVEWTARQYVAEENQVGIAPAMLSGVYFGDLNEDGLNDDNMGIEGATVSLYLGGVELAQVLTAADGSYTFDGLAAGSGYSVAFENPNVALGQEGLSFVTTGVDSDVIGVGPLGNGVTAEFDLVAGQQLIGLDGGVSGLGPLVEEPLDPPVGSGEASYALVGADSFLFDIDSGTGEIAPKDWFEPSLDDAWDQNEDHIYEVTRIVTPGNGEPDIREELRFETTGDGILSGMPAPEDPVIEPVIPDPGPVPDPGPETPAPEGAAYSLEGPDALLFWIDEETGAIETKDWFTPSYDDAWDVDENHIYELIRVASPPEGGDSAREDIRYEVTPDDELLPYLSGEALMSVLALPVEDIETQTAALESIEPFEEILELAM